MQTFFSFHRIFFFVLDRGIFFSINESQLVSCVRSAGTLDTTEGLLNESRNECFTIPHIECIRFMDLDIFIQEALPIISLGTKSFSLTSNLVMEIGFEDEIHLNQGQRRRKYKRNNDYVSFRKFIARSRDEVFFTIQMEPGGNVNDLPLLTNIHAKNLVKEDPVIIPESIVDRPNLSAFEENWICADQEVISMDDSFNRTNSRLDISCESSPLP